MQNNSFDLIIIGGGPSGLTAGIFASRASLNTLLIEKMGCGGQTIIADWIENYPGYPQGISGIELSGKIEEQARKFGLIIRNEEVFEVIIQKNSQKKIIRTAKNRYSTHEAIAATG